MSVRAEISRGVVWIGLFALLVTPAGADEPRPTRLVAEDALIVVDLTKPATLIDRLTGERVGALLNETPAYRDALGTAQARHLMDAAQVVAGALDTDVPTALRKLTGGGLVMAVERRDDRILVYFVVTPEDPAFLERAHAKVVELARKDAADNGRPDPITETTYRDVRGFALSKEEAHAIVGGRLLIANSVEGLNRLIDRAKDGVAKSIEDDPRYQAAREPLKESSLGWAFARLDRLREVDPKRFTLPERVNPLGMLLFGGWIESLRSAPWLALGLAWDEDQLAAQVALPAGSSDAIKRYIPPAGSGAPAPLTPPRTIASLGLWRDLSSLWEVRADLVAPEVVQGLAQLDTVAGQFFGGRDFGTGVLGALAADWRLVVARQDAEQLDPAPDVKLPAFALVVGLKPDDAEFAIRLKSAFQSFIGLANLGAAQTKAPPLMLGSEPCEGETIATSHFVAPDAKGGDEPIHLRHNFSPSAVQVGDHFVLSSSLGLAKDLVKLLKESPAEPRPETVVLKADGEELAHILDDNRKRLVMQNMLEKGHDKAKAEAEVSYLSRLARFLGRGTLTADDRGDLARFRLRFDLGAAR